MDYLIFFAGAACTMLAQGAVVVGRHFVAWRDEAQRSAALCCEADRRRRDAEDRLRLAECDLARQGVELRKTKRVNVKPV